jgi:PAS domain S-box-containing protein
MKSENLKTLQRLTDALTNGIDEIRLKAELLGILFNSINCGVFIVGSDKRILAANNAIIHALGYRSEDELIGKTPMTITAPGQFGATTEDIHKLWDEAFSGRAFSKAYLKKDGTLYKANIKLFHLHNQLGEVARTVIIIEGVKSDAGY